jgi:hypothetical protein
MNTPGYRKAYMANLQAQITNNNKNFAANKGNPASHQYMKASGQTVLGVPTFKGETNVQAKGTKIKF